MRKRVLSLLLGFSVLVSANASYAVSMNADARYMYLYRTLSELPDGQQAEAVVDAQNIARDKLKALFPNSKFDTAAFDALEADHAKIESVIGSVKHYVEGLDLDRFGFRSTDLIPNGIIMTAGARVSVDAAIGISGSIYLGLVLVPQRVSRLDLVTGRTDDYWVVDWTVVGIPNVGVGVGAGGGLTGRAAFGLIFGRLKRASDFKGVSATISGDVNLGIGFYAKFGAVSAPNTPGLFNYAYVMAGPSAGPDADATIHGNFGYIFGPAAVIKMALAQIGLGPKPTPEELKGQVTVPAAKTP